MHQYLALGTNSQIAFVNICSPGWPHCLPFRDRHRLGPSHQSQGRGGQSSFPTEQFPEFLLLWTRIIKAKSLLSPRSWLLLPGTAALWKGHASCFLEKSWFTTSYCPNKFILKSCNSQQYFRKYKRLLKNKQVPQSVRFHTWVKVKCSIIQWVHWLFSVIARLRGGNRRRCRWIQPRTSPILSQTEAIR